MSIPAPRPVSPWLRVTAWIGVLAWVVAISILSSMSPSELHRITTVQMWDKAEHFLAFAAGAANLALVVRWSTAWPPARVALVAILAIAFFGAIDEIHQLFTPGRSGGDPFDWIADTLGAAAGAGATLLFHVRRSHSRVLAPAGD